MILQVDLSACTWRHNSDSLEYSPDFMHFRLQPVLILPELLIYDAIDSWGQTPAEGGEGKGVGARGVAEWPNEAGERAPPPPPKVELLSSRGGGGGGGGVGFGEAPSPNRALCG